MKKRTKVRLITFALSGFALLGGFWLDTHLTLQASSTQLEYVYRRALGDLTDSVSAMQSTLQKAQYAGTPATQTAVSSELLEQAGEAKSAIASLPFSPEKSGRFNRFLSQAVPGGRAPDQRGLRKPAYPPGLRRKAYRSPHRPAGAAYGGGRRHRPKRPPAQ